VGAEPDPLANMKKIHRFIGPYPLGQGTIRIDDAQLSSQLRSVLKLSVGETIIIGDGSGTEVECRILEYQKDAVLVEGISLSQNTNELPLRTTLYCSVLKADHFELAMAKATEVGITRIVPLISARTVKLNLRLDRVKKIVREAAELAGRGVVPEVTEIMDLDHAFTDARVHAVNYFFDPSGGSFTPPVKSVESVGIFIGPEGGWTEQEIGQAEAYGMKMVSLGNLILRAETAVVVAAYMVAHRQKM
jgi:16S rRNA (uracil1498-N3)-methyltransferase